MQRMLDMVAGIDWGVFIQRVLWSLPLTVLVILACVFVFRLTDNIGQRKIDYVYAPEEQKTLIRERQKVVRRRILVCVFWVVLIIEYAIQCVLDYIVTGGGM